ncbi:MAG: HlyD family efflux transporter periplasmic adaptor subunit [Pseudanabaena sp.]
MAERSSAIFWVLNCPIYLLRCYRCPASPITPRSSRMAVGSLGFVNHSVSRIQVELQTETAAQEAAIARLEAELRNAELEDRRHQYLQKEGAVSASLRDSKQLTSDTVRQQLNEAKAQLSRITRSRQSQIAESRATLDQIAEVRPVDVELARSQVAQAEAGVARAKADLDLAIVRSPQGGQVLKIHTRAGELVGNNGIISLGQTQRMVAVAEVYELDINRVKVGQSATVISKNNAFSETLRGKVKEVGLQISKKDILNAFRVSIFFQPF